MQMSRESEKPEISPFGPTELKKLRRVLRTTYFAQQRAAEMLAKGLRDSLNHKKKNLNLWHFLFTSKRKVGCEALSFHVKPAVTRQHGVRRGDSES